MVDCMEFPETWGEFADYYGYVDKSRKVFVGDVEVIPRFRAEQWLEFISRRAKSMNFEVDTEAMLMEYPQDQEENEYRFIDAAWLDKVSAGLTAGAVKHPGETWKSIPPEEHAARAIRHLNMYRKGDRSEDHLINASMRCMMASVLADEIAAEEKRDD